MEMNRIAVFMMNRVAQVKHYNWSNEFNVSEMLEAYDKSIEFLSEEFDILSLNKEELVELGFSTFSEESELMLIPIWAYDLIPNGTKLTGLFGGEYIKGKDEVDMDIRGGCLAFGIIVQ